MTNMSCSVHLPMGYDWSCSMSETSCSTEAISKSSIQTCSNSSSEPCRGCCSVHCCSQMSAVTGNAVSVTGMSGDVSGVSCAVPSGGIMSSDVSSVTVSELDYVSSVVKLSVSTGVCVSVCGVVADVSSWSVHTVAQGDVDSVGGSFMNSVMSESVIVTMVPMEMMTMDAGMISSVSVMSDCVVSECVSAVMAVNVVTKTV